MLRKEKLLLDFEIVDKRKVQCNQRCSYEIDAKDILNLHCLALESSKYKKKLTCMIDSLRDFMTKERTMGMQEPVKCGIRINGKKVCIACNVLAIGYSRCKIMNLIAEIQNNGHCADLYGNIHCHKEKNNITMARILFKQYVKDFGESMPHRKMWRLKDDALVQKICLPMNVRRAEIWLTINSKLRRLGEPSIGLPIFYKMWKQEFMHVYIPKSSQFSKCNICREYKN
jgi:hypothetical protein